MSKKSNASSIETIAREIAEKAIKAVESGEKIVVDDPYVRDSKIETDGHGLIEAECHKLSYRFGELVFYKAEEIFAEYEKKGIKP